VKTLKRRVEAFERSSLVDHLQELNLDDEIDPTKVNESVQNLSNKYNKMSVGTTRHKKTKTQI
jgi:type III secretion system FlhB-like substrate exporter